jgi:mono/diheme cytochrome c family protein
VDVAIQAMLTMNRWSVPNAAAAIRAAMDRHPVRGVHVVANAILNPPATGGRRGGRGGAGLDPEYAARLDRGGQIYNEVCAACHGHDALGTPKPELGTTMAPALAGSQRVSGHRDYVVNAILHGMTGPIDGRTYTDVMLPMATNDDEWIASVASYVRASFGNRAGGVTPADVARVRASTTNRTTSWTVGELTASLPVRIFTDGWKTSASQNSDAAGGGLTLTGWNTGTPQRAGMWFQIDMPAARTLTEIQFLSPVPGGTGAAVSASGAPVQPQEISGFGFPRAFRIDVSPDGTNWTTVAEDASRGATTIVAFPPARATKLRITLTAGDESGPAWSLQDLRVFGLP